MRESKTGGRKWRTLLNYTATLVCISSDFSQICNLKQLNNCSLTFQEVVTAYTSIASPDLRRRFLIMSAAISLPASFLNFLPLCHYFRTSWFFPDLIGWHSHKQRKTLAFWYCFSTKKCSSQWRDVICNLPISTSLLATLWEWTQSSWWTEKQKTKNNNNRDCLHEA